MRALNRRLMLSTTAASLAFATALRTSLAGIKPKESDIEAAERLGFDYAGVLKVCAGSAEAIESLLRYIKSEETSHVEVIEIWADEWQKAVAQFLVRHDGVGMAEVAREALGRSYGQMSTGDWGRLAVIMKDLGLRQHGGLWWWPHLRR